MTDLTNLIKRATTAIELATSLGARGDHASDIYNITDELVSALTTLQAEKDALRAELDGANETLRKCFGEDTAALVARALAAEQALADEREACAKVAEGLHNASTPDHPLFGQGMANAADQIAAAIRSRASEDKR